MPKYYVSTGSFRRAISRNCPRDAAIDALKQDISAGGDHKEYGNVTEVSEIGFKFKPNEGIFFPTPNLLNAC